MTDTPELDRLREIHRQVGALLDEPHPGLFTWRISLSQRLMDMADYAGFGFVHTFPNVLKALKALVVSAQAPDALIDHDIDRALAAIASAEGSPDVS